MNGEAPTSAPLRTELPGTEPPRSEGLDRLAAGLALVGGALLLALASTVFVSVILRADAIGLRGVPGDFELVQMGTAVAAFCFFPYCLVRRGHIFVDTFTTWLPERARRALDAFWDVAFGLALALIAWRLGVGAADAVRSNENTMVLRLPLFAPIGICAALAAFSAFVAFVSARRRMLGQALAPGPVDEIFPA